jgi:hypothetical protein
MRRLFLKLQASSEANATVVSEFMASGVVGIGHVGAAISTGSHATAKEKPAVGRHTELSMTSAIAELSSLQKLPALQAMPIAETCHPSVLVNKGSPPPATIGAG